MLFKRELLNEPMPTSKNYEDYSILPHWFEMPNRWSILTSRCIITGFEKQHRPRFISQQIL